MPIFFVLPAFLLSTLMILAISWPSLKRSGSHGFFRFLAWETILILFLRNLKGWFAQPLSLHQILSWLCLLASIYLVVEGARLLRRRGRPDNRREDPSLVGIEKTTMLVTDGLYGYIRHPLYSSLLNLAWGLFFKSPGWIDSGFAALATVFLWQTARVEEQENIQFFGEAYKDYIQKTKRFFPFVF